ncbi:transcription-associated protein 1 [Rhizina undulata]
MAGGNAHAEVYAARLGDNALDAKLKLQIASELRDSIDMFTHTPTEYNKFLQRLMPVFKGILSSQPVFISTSPEQKLRNITLDTIHRLPFQPPEALEPYAGELMTLLMNLVRIENEENAVLCMKTIMDFQRYYTKQLVDKVQPFLDLIKEMFQMMPKAVKDTFDNPWTSGGTPGMPGTPGNTGQNFQSPKPMSPMMAGQDPPGEAQQPAKMLVRGMQSFKVLAECPIIVVSLFQAHKNCVYRNVKAFVPLIKEMLLLQAGPQEEAHKLAKSKGEVFTGVSPNVKNRAAFGEFITAQVKTMSFLAYVLRVYAQQLTDFLPTLPEIVVRLLKDCPRERSSARKELLVATRHIINFNFRKIFLNKIDELLDERVLIGDGLTVYETMRPLAYSMLADLIHHVRESLNRDQIGRTVEVYTKNLHDTFPGTSFQTMSAKLLLNLAEYIAKLPDKQEARHFLIMILDAIADKFAAMNRQYPNAVKQSRLNALANEVNLTEEQKAVLESAKKEEPDEVDIFMATPIKTSNPRERGADPVADNRFLFKNLMNGLKSMLFALRTCNPTSLNNEHTPANWSEVAYGFNAEEVNIIIKLFREGAHVFRYYSAVQDTDQSASPVDILANHFTASSGKEEKDLLETFATVFHCIDPATFHEVFDSEIPHLYDMMFEHTTLLHVPQFFLASEATSPSFCGMLLQFLMGHIEEVGTSDTKKAQILLRLFKLSFMAVTLFSTQNEQVLLPHVSKIVLKSIELSKTAEQPMNYFLLLRSLFRSIGGGRFEHLYKEILPLLEVLLEFLNTLLLSARKVQERDLYVELCLTVPARLSNLLPHLNYLMKPLVVALKAGPELVSQGLRTLELCVDNLTADYLDPIMAPVIDDLMAALWDHLKPLPYNYVHSHTTMCILGKLGGRNRRFLTHPPSLSYKLYSDDDCSVNIKLHGAPGERPFPTLTAVNLAVERIMDMKPQKTDQDKKMDIFYKQQSLRILGANLKLFIGYDHLPEDFSSLVRLQANDLAEGKVDLPPAVIVSTDKNKPIFKKHDQESTLRKLIRSVMHAVAIKELEDEAFSLISDVCRHFTIVELGKAVFEMRQKKQQFVINSGEGPMYLDTKVLAEAIADCLSADSKEVREASKKAMGVIYDTAATFFGSKEHVWKLPFFFTLAKVFCHGCYEEEWYPKAGGCSGIRVLTENLDMGETWMVERQHDFVRALLYVIKDMPQDLPASTRELAQSTLDLVLRKCNQNVSKEEITTYHSKSFNLCALLICELSNPNKHVRETAQLSFATLSSISGVDIHNLMRPVKERLLNPIFNKPLRALPFASQIGYIDAITYCLHLQPAFLEFNEEMNRLMMEALALADADDDALANNRIPEHRTTESVLNLRVVCIKLLSTAITYPEYAAPEKNQTRGRIISVFFKSLYSKSPEVIEAANAGLKGVLAQTNKLPKDLLQNGLRPILMNLSDPKRLNVAGLEGLARLLELLTNYFKVEIGSRLLDHLKNLADPATLQQTSYKLLEQNGSIKVIASILNIFHLLPPAAAQFLQEMFNIIIDLESKLRRTQQSPFRAPLLKFVNRYPGETWEFIKTKMAEMSYGRLFAQLLQDDSSAPLREKVCADASGLLASLTAWEGKGDDEFTAIIDVVAIVNSIGQYKGTTKWFGQNRELMNALLHAGVQIREKLKDGEIPVPIRLAVEQASGVLLEIFMTYLTHAPDDLDFLFLVIDVTTSGKLKKTHALTHYIYSKIICTGSIEHWRNVIFRCLELYATKTSTQETKTFAFHYLVNPILVMDVHRGSPHVNGQRLVDKHMIENIHAKVWKPNLGDLGDDASPGLDHSRMELLQMSALLIRDHDAILAEARKDVIKFGWNYIKLEDIINKQAAYVLIAFFIKHYDTPSKIVIQIYVALLKAHQHEARALVTQALELLAPVLKKRVPNASDPRYPIWARWPRRILSEEGHNQQQMTNIFQFLVRHEDLFYESREHFLTWIVTSLPKLIPNLPNSSTENKKLSINLITLIWKWEKLRVETLRNSPVTSPSRKRKLPMPTNSRSPSIPTSQSTSEKTEYAVATPLRQMVIKHLISFICGLNEKFSSSDLCPKAVKLLEDFLGPEYWGDLEIDLSSKVIETNLITNEVNEQNLPGYVNALQVLSVIMKLKSDEWVLQRLNTLQKVLEKSLRSDNAEVQESLQPVLSRVLQAIPIEKVEGEDEEEEPAESPGAQFVSLLTTIVQENLNTNLMSSVNILWTLSQKRPMVIDDHIAALMKAFQKLGKDHLSAPPGAPTPIVNLPNSAKLDGTTGNSQVFDPATTTKLLRMVIDVAASRVSVLGDQRRPFLSVMAQLVEKSQSSELCEKILHIVRGWVFGFTESFPTLKEKTAVLSKMLSFETRADANLCNKFLELVINIYEDPAITKTELTVRLEHAFLIGTRAKDVTMRNRFLQIFDRSLSRTISNRISFVLGTQNWETLGNSYWLHQASHLLFGSVDMENRVVLHQDDIRLTPASSIFSSYAGDKRKDELMLDDKFEELMFRHRKFIHSLMDVRAGDIFEPIAQLQHLDSNIGHQIWINLFPLCWSALGKEDRQDLSRGLVALLSKDYHHRQMDKRPNVVQSLFEGVERATPKLTLPPHVVKYLSKTYDAWYTALHLMEDFANFPPIDSAAVRESNLDALAEMYAAIQEEDMFYGLWRRRAQYLETNAALSFEQNGMWDKAQQMYENAQIKARTGVVPFSHSEYMLWEDHWVLCAQKLQQWEILSEFAKHENYNDLFLECGWRLLENWNSGEGERMDSTIKSLLDAPTPRRFFFAAFMALQKVHQKAEVPGEFSRLCDEAIQLSLRKWHNLPRRITNAHIPLLQAFQQLVELHDASVIYSSLSNTNAQNLDQKSQELKLLLGTWRDRLPNVWDDINSWHDLVTWRQHIFHSINNTYLPLLPAQAQSAGGSTSNSSYAYRGYHETAWIINRFAHVARKHQLPEVCISQLSKIYTLPNIEIQEAFLKLREQAKCHYQNPNELTQGLEVINNTNLNYFGAQQKAEFYTLKGMFLSKLKQKDEANEAFGHALCHDLKLPKAWAEWGYYSDSLFKENPQDMQPAGNAVSCYLEAAGLFKSGKARKLLSRVLWLLSLDDASALISTAFDAYKGEMPVWYWITYIPQLLTSLSHKEARLARGVLIKIAKNYPQALYFLLRTSREDYQVIKKQTAAAAASNRGKAGSPVVSQAVPPNRQGSIPGQPQPTGVDAARAASPQQNPATLPQANGTPGPQNGILNPQNINSPAAAAQSPQPQIKRLPWEYAEEIMSVLKTAFPLLALSMETMGDQIQKFFKCPPDEDAYRLIVALLNDGLQWIARMNPSLEDSKLPPSTESNITRFAETILPAHIRVAFEADFVAERPTLFSYIERLRKWRDRFEEKLDRRPPYQNLEMYSPHLSEFRFQKFDDVEVPGQYLLHKDNNKDFIRIDRFLPRVDVIRGYGVCHRRLKMRGHDGSVHAFAIQHPAARHCRREERILQLFRIFNGILSRRKESRRRNLGFHLPLMVPLAPHIRIVQDDASYISLQGIYEDYCRQTGMSKDDPLIFSLKRVIASLDPSKPSPQQMVDPNVKLEIYNAIQRDMVPKTIALDFLSKSFTSFTEFFLFRRQFSYQFAALTFMTYVMNMSNRFPHKMFIARDTGNIWGSELIPAMASTNAFFHNPEQVPFRFTPNIQTLMGPIAIEGIFSCAVMAIARCLTEPEFELEQHLSVFVRDEMIFWFTQQHRSSLGEQQLREKVQQNSEIIVRRATSLAQATQGNLPANQTVIDLISKAANPLHLAQLDNLWMPYL